MSLLWLMFFFLSWAAQDLTIDSTCRILMDQALIFDQTNKATLHSVGVHSVANLRFHSNTICWFHRFRKSPSQEKPGVLVFCFFFLRDIYSCKRNPFSFFFEWQEQHLSDIGCKKSPIYLYRLQSSWHRRLLLCPHGCWIMYRSQILGYMRS